MRKTLAITALAAMLAATACAQTKGGKSKTELSMERQGMVDIHTKDKSIQVSLMYSRADNFTGTVLYTDLTRAYLHPKAAAALAKAQARLKQLRDKVKGTSKYFYVSNPARGGGLHNYGMAVDITLCDAKGDTLDMGTKIDYMGSAAHIDKEDALVSSGRISRQAQKNRQLLRQVMRYAGFRSLRTEWWHFNLVSRATARKYYKVIK